MLQDAIMQNQNLLISPEKTFELPVYAKQMASSFADFGCSKPKCHKDGYVVAVLQFIDGCRAPLLEECPQHHGHKGDPGVTPGTCGTIGERTQVILV